jgi:hypothetical protein
MEPFFSDGAGGGPALGVDVTGEPHPPELASPLPVAEVAVSAIGACLAAAGELSLVRTGRRPTITLDTAHAAAAVRSESWLRDPAGQAVEGFAPLSRLWPAADGWVRTHANYPWHRAALLSALSTSDPSGVGDAVAARPALEVERIVYQAGGLAVAARTRDAFPTAPGPLVSISTVDDAPPLPAPGALPASGIRVLDLTRVIAGPVGTRMLGALGADVLRLDHPDRPELPGQAVEGVVGKRSALLDAGTPDGLDRLHRLVGQADVLVTGYRPGALRRLGLDPDRVTDRHPGTIVVTLSAWGDTPGWAGRRGFDSLVQIATGIGWETTVDGSRPGVLPCQLLDHATGYLIAAGALAALAQRARTGTASHVSLSLARTAQWLLTAPSSGSPPPDASALDGEAFRVPFGNGWSGIAPPGTVDGVPLAWPHLPPAYGHAKPAFE